MGLLRNLIIVFFLLCSHGWAGVDFDGTDDFLCSEDPSGLVTGDPMTVTAWIYPDSVTGEHNIMADMERVGTDSGWSISTDGDELNFVTRGVKGYGTTTFTLVTGEWQFVAASMQADHDVIFYHYRPSTDTLSSEEDTHTADMNAPDNTDLLTGVLFRNDQILFTCAAATKESYFNGKITEIAIWDTALTQAEIVQLSSSRVKRMPFQIQSANLKGYWPLDDEEDGSSADGDVFSDLVGSNPSTGDDGAGNSGLTAKAEEVLTYP